MLTNQASITLNDAATTPVAHVFSPVRSGDGIPTWVDKEHNDGIAIGYSKVTYSCREPVKSGGVYRQIVTMAVPYVDFTVPAKPVLVGTARVNCQFLFPDTMSSQNRKDVVKQFYNLLAQGSATAIGDNIVDQTEPY
jgi:hypothetical protein